MDYMYCNPHLHSGNNWDRTSLLSLDHNYNYIQCRIVLIRPFLNCQNKLAMFYIFLVIIKLVTMILTELQLLLLLLLLFGIVLGGQ